MKTFKVTRLVTTEECDWFKYHTFDEVPKGTVVYEFMMNTFGSIDTRNGIAVSAEPNEYPFFELPRDCLEEVDSI